ncbi:late embryogenesis abundant protein At5g17165-like [Primulina eburnea]|uniref:late embryogenesis abundant protein At5g17165-like n=1 Tax=Primulina eburnea TaxID=1245227 RepID=UPI003C6CAC61
MAVNTQSLKLASLGKRFVSYLRSPVSSILPSSSLRNRRVHDSVYEKNYEEFITEHSHATVVPDYLIPLQTEEYWAPHPQTGVFGPAVDQSTSPVDNSTDLGLSTTNTNSVLEQKAFFRHSEDLDKPVVEP